MRKQFRGAMLALATMAGVIGSTPAPMRGGPASVQSRQSNAPAPSAPGASSVVNLRVPGLPTRINPVLGRHGGIIWTGREKRGNRRGRASRFSYFR